jgi:hypothetical protein
MEPTTDPDHHLMRRALKIGPLLLAALAAGVLAAGCGSDGAGAVLDPVAKAAQTTGEAQGAKLEMHVRLNLGSLGGQISLDARGHVNFKAREGEISMQFSGLPAQAAAAIPDGTTMSEVFSGTTVYIESPLFEGKLPNGARWAKLDLAATAKTLGLDPSSLGSGEANPAQLLEYLRSLGGEVRQSGTESVRGVATTHYSGTIDLHKVLEKLPASESGAAKAALDQVISRLGGGTIPVQVWVDGQQMVRKMEIEFPIAAGGQTLESSVTVEFFDFGASAPVRVPAGSETFELSPGALGSAG